MKINEFMNIMFIGLVFFFILILPKNVLAQTISNCSLNIYPQPTTGTHRYTITINNNTSIPGYYFINNYFVDGSSGGNPSNISTPSYYNYWFIQNGSGYQVDGWAGIPIINGSISYDVDLTFNYSFDGIDLALRGNGSTTDNICSQGHGTYSITNNDLSTSPIPTPPSIMPSPAPEGDFNCGLNIYPQPSPGTHNYTVTLTNNTSKLGYFFVNNYFFDNYPWGRPSNVNTTSDWYIHAPTVLGYMVTGTARTPVAANSSINYTTDLTFSNSFNGVDIALSTYNTYTGANINDICNQPRGTYIITYNDPGGTPTPSPTPKTTSKVFFVPGLGGSWNLDALINCKSENYLGGWTLAPYSEDVYNPILSAIASSGWTVKPFYYDWRSEISSNSSILGDSIDTLSTDDEKVNIVGHSMGGIVAADYASKDKGTKINSLMAVGSPFNGAVQAYPAWAGGDIWEDNFISKIAMTLYLKRCGGVFSNNRVTLQDQIPSINNLLPKLSYLVDAKTHLPVDNSNTINNWSVNLIDLLSINFKTLTGNGFKTLSQIQTKNPNKKDLSQGDWLDGKAAGKIFSTQGDGTVLLSSSVIDSDHNETINQTHSGLVGSSEGIGKILEFLGTPPTTLSSTFSEPNSALIIIGYPSNFWVTDLNGNTKKDKNGMVALMNPKSGNYRLNLIPQSNSTLFIVAQFLPNGEIKYKEYNLDGPGPKLKTIKLDLQNPLEDPLN